MSALQVPPLEGWVTVAQAAELLGITRQAVHKKILDGTLQSARRLGSVSKPIFILEVGEIDDLVGARKS